MAAASVIHAAKCMARAARRRRSGGAAQGGGVEGFQGPPMGATLALDMPIEQRTIRSANVIGILPGTDKTLAQEAVLYTAHHDHLGKALRPRRRRPSTTARSTTPPAAPPCWRSRTRPPSRRPGNRIIVAFVTAEEQGLLGSEWLAQHPPVPANRIAADINLDSVNKWGKTTDLGVTGLGKSTADEVIRKVAAEQGRAVHGDPHPDRGSFYRSDMFSMAHVGVPPVAVKGGPDYAGRPKGWATSRRWTTSATTTTALRPVPRRLGSLGRRAGGPASARRRAAHRQRSAPPHLDPGRRIRGRAQASLALTSRATVPAGRCRGRRPR